MTTALGKVMIVNKGDYDAASSYAILDVVTHAGSSYVALRDVTGVTPVDDGINWKLLAAKGDTGDKGDPGDSGSKTNRMLMLEDEEALKGFAYVRTADGVPSEYTADNYGWGMVSDPSCLAVAEISGMYSSSYFGICKIVEKGSRAGDSGMLMIEQMDLGYPYINRHDQRYIVEGNWVTVDGYPIPAYEMAYAFQSSENVAAKTLCFAWGGVIYNVVINQRQYNGIRQSGCLVPSEGANITNATVETLNGLDLVVMEDPNSNHFFVVGSSKTEAIAIKPNTPIGTNGTLETDRTPISGAKAFFSLGDNTQLLNKAGEIVFAFSTGFTKEGTKEAVAGALTADWRTAFAACQEYWKGVFSGLREQWANAPAKVRVKGYLAVGQMMCHTYSGDITPGLFLGAGAGSWYGDFIRDTAFAVRALSASRPELAGAMLDFYAGCGPIYEHNSYSLDGVAGTGHNTDNAPTFLLAVGEYYKHTQDLPRMQALESQINSAMKYILSDFGNHYNASDGHIETLHPHDYGDDSNDYFVMADTLYESMVDILWIVGLEAISPVFAALGDQTQADNCLAIATNLRNHLSDFIVPTGERAGMMAHGIKNDLTLDADQANWAATFIYGAWLLGRTDCWDWCKRATNLYTKTTPLPYSLSIVNNYTSEAPAHGWGPFYPIVALLEYRFEGRSRSIQTLLDYFPSGGFPEYIQHTFDTKGLPKAYTHATNFPWSHASIIEMVNEVAQAEL
jgi:hypothetical protein